MKLFISLIPMIAGCLLLLGQFGCASAQTQQTLCYQSFVSVNASVLATTDLVQTGIVAAPTGLVVANLASITQADLEVWEAAIVAGTDPGTALPVPVTSDLGNLNTQLNAAEPASLKGKRKLKLKAGVASSLPVLIVDISQFVVDVAPIAESWITDMLNAGSATAAQVNGETSILTGSISALTAASSAPTSLKK